jgi:1-acyl-sn-glycerol-3-phosphate acyltransferase
MPRRPIIALLDLAYAPLAMMVFLVTAVPLSLLVIAAPTLALRRAIGRASMRVVMACIGAPIRVRGLEHLPAGPALCVSNHASYLDGLVLTAALPARFTFVVQDGAARWPLVGWVIRRMGVVFVNRSAARSSAVQTRALLKRVQAGESLTIFPEGTFKAEPGLLSFKDGAFMMAAKANVPVVPAVISGTRRLWGGGRRLPRWSRCHIALLPPQHPTGSDREQVRALRDSVRAAILRHCDEPDRARGPSAESPHPNAQLKQQIA